MDIVAALSSATGALKVINELRSINNEFDKAELKAKLADVMNNMSDARMGLVEAGELLSSKEREIDVLKRAIRKRDDETVEVKGYRYRKSPEGMPLGYPYCPICVDEGFFVITVSMHEPGRPVKCPKCRANFGSVMGFNE